MKSIFKMVMIFFALAISLLLKPLSLQAPTIENQALIAHPEQEAVVLVSNNLWQGEVRSSQEESQYNLGGASSFVSANLDIKDDLLKNKTQINGCFIHNLSTNNQKVQQIRAP